MYTPQLETFLRVADAGSFNKAAEEIILICNNRCFYLCLLF